MKYDYTFFPESSNEKFKEACKLISQSYPSAIKKRLLVDVDGSLIQTFVIGEAEIDVYNDIDVGAVFVKSDISLADIFPNAA